MKRPSRRPALSTQGVPGLGEIPTADFDGSLDLVRIAASDAAFAAVAWATAALCALSALLAWMPIPGSGSFRPLQADDPHS